MRRRNLEVVTGAVVRRVLLDGRAAIGVEVQTDAGIHVWRARREVIVAAGTFHSPHLLLNSGIGDANELAAAGVTPMHDLPAVGRNLRDHPAVPLAMETNDSTSYALSARALPRNAAQILLAGYR